VRASLKQSLQDSPVGGDESFRYPKGSIVICNSCTAPVAVLERGITVGDKAGRMANALKPLTSTDLDLLALRDDVDPGVVAWVRNLTPEERKIYLESLHDYRAGDPMLCPICDKCFVQVLSVERNEMIDKAYVIELVTLAPYGQNSVAIRGKRISADGDWIHEGARLN
jgi:uncharacterized Zn-binding protein involved in type VI secretion